MGRYTGAADRLMLITHRESHNRVASQMEGYLLGGGRFVQLRIKGYCARGIDEEAAWARSLCDTYGGSLIVNDHVEAARSSGAYGVHLGASDMPVAEARRVLGPEVVIGATAHNLKEGIEGARSGADYLGVGPLRFTSTKERLAPILGVGGVLTLLEALRSAGVDLPVYVVGGVESGDVRALLRGGVYGVAVSAGIALASDPQFATEKYLEAIDKAIR